jgi:peptidoglycan/xylan/chitin deacetylase (PgdA/CDA1 family)
MTLSRRTLLAAIAGLVGATVLDGCSSASGRAASTVVPGPTGSATSVAPSAPATTALPGAAPPATTTLATATSIDASTSTPATASPATAAAGAPAAFVDHGASTDSVGLTFHLSGRTDLVTQLLDLLQARGVQVTAFCVGSWLTANPDIGHRMVAEGHELGNHTEHHLDMAQLTGQQLYDEIAQCGQALVPFIGSIGTWFRPSSTVVPNQAILDAAGRAGYRFSVGYDVDSVDNRDPGADAIVGNVTGGLHAGAIVSMHFGHVGTIKALPRILDHLQAVGLRPVTVGSLLG